ncbi:hypothetical protein CPC08DRAFT_640312 [Agrocybe pediades]|nr:hypothetical protein CPC08DRAFT_640312 [Agrocybe pediades]
MDSDSYTFEVTPPTLSEMHNPWDNINSSPYLPPQQSGTRPRVHSMNDSVTPRNEKSSFDFSSARIPFPEPMTHPSASYQPPRSGHHHSRSELVDAPTSHRLHANRNPSVTSFASSYHVSNDYDDGFSEFNDHEGVGGLVQGLSDLSLASEEGLRRFQQGQLAESDQEWHRLVPEEAREALGKQEVQRQSVLFEVIKSERDYVADLEAVEQVFIDGLRTAKPPIIKPQLLNGFIDEVFGNLRDILTFHRRILDALFARQREQHPLLQSVADIILDTVLLSEFRSAYETYIKHYPLAESHHRKQLKQNRAYEAFILSSANDPRIRKRDLITFLSRPVTKLPRLNLLLEQILKLTDVEFEHPDLETLPIILSILKDCIKSTQPGIEAAESKVKFWELCESLIFQRGEIIDMDLYDESRTLVYIGTVFRRNRSETGLTEKWVELTAALMDNYFILTKEGKGRNGSVKRVLMSRPIPLSFLRLGFFEGAAESRREKAEDGGLLETFRSQSVPMYPFTIYHAFSRGMRRYTLYVASDALRTKWKNCLLDAIGVHKVRQESNMWFNPQTLTDGFFRTVGHENPQVNGLKFTGKILCAAPFVNSGRRLLAVGCGRGIYVAPASSEKFQLVLHSRFPVALSAYTTLGDKVFNRLVVQADSSLVSYSLDIMARLALGQTSTQTLDASMERICNADTNLVFYKHVHSSGNSLLIYASKRRLGTSLNMKVLEAVDASEVSVAPKKSGKSTLGFFRPRGEPGYVPKDAYDVVSLVKTIGICTADGIVMADPTDLAKSPVGLVPEFRDAGNNPPLAMLKSRIEGLKPLGIVKVDTNEFLVVYDELGCYINKNGIPARKCAFIKWEIKAVSYAHRNGQLLLICPEFIEVRSITTGRIVQVIEGREMRLLYCGPYTSKDDPILIAMRGGKDDQDGVSERIAELVETEEISLMTPSTISSTMWDEWDM